MNIVNEAKKLTDMYRGWKFNDIMNAFPWHCIASSSIHYNEVEYFVICNRQDICTHFVICMT